MDLMRYISKIRSFMKREAVLSVALALALFSAFLVHPDEEYLSLCGRPNLDSLYFV